MDYQHNSNAPSTIPMAHNPAAQNKAYAGASAAGIAQVPTPSLAVAFEMLNAEVGALEEAAKRLYDRAQPFLEPSAPSDAMAKDPGRAASPLAQSVFEYATRVRIARSMFNDIADRISL